MIYTASIASCFVGFFMLYNTSRKAKLSTRGSFEKWLQQNKAFARATGLVLFVLPFVLLPVKDGVGVGMFTAFLLLMTAAALVVMIAPFHYLRLRHVAALIAASLLLEFLFF